MDFLYCPLRKKYDSELTNFIDGRQCRDGIIDRIDEEVCAGVQDFIDGQPVPIALRKLVCYAVWGHPVDAYKWYEFTYQ